MKTPEVILLDIPHPIIAFSQVKRLNGIPIIPPGHSKSIAHTLRTAALTTLAHNGTQQSSQRSSPSHPPVIRSYKWL